VVLRGGWSIITWYTRLCGGGDPFFGLWPFVGRGRVAIHYAIRRTGDIVFDWSSAIVYADDVQIHPPQDLLGSNPMKWYVTNASSEDDFIVQGTIVVAVATPVATGATHIPLWLTWECELAGDIAAVLQIFRPLPEEAKEDNQSELEVISVADSGRPTPSVGQLLRASRASTALIQRPRGPK